MGSKQKGQKANEKIGNKNEWWVILREPIKNFRKESFSTEV